MTKYKVYQVLILPLITTLFLTWYIQYIAQSIATIFLNNLHKHSLVDAFNTYFTLNTNIIELNKTAIIKEMYIAVLNYRTAIIMVTALIIITAIVICVCLITIQQASLCNKNKLNRGKEEISASVGEKIRLANIANLLLYIGVTIISISVTGNEDIDTKYSNLIYHILEEATYSQDDFAQYGVAFQACSIQGRLNNSQDIYYLLPIKIFSNEATDILYMESYGVQLELNPNQPIIQGESMIELGLTDNLKLTQEDYYVFKLSKN